MQETCGREHKSAEGLIGMGLVCLTICAISLFITRTVRDCKARKFEKEIRAMEIEARQK